MKFKLLTVIVLRTYTILFLYTTKYSGKITAFSEDENESVGGVCPTVRNIGLGLIEFCRKNEYFMRSVM